MVTSVMVTGGSGFIGGALLKHLMKNGKWVLNYDIKTDNDVLDFCHLKHTLESYNIDLVYHLAAQPIVPIANKDPYPTLVTNIMGTLNVLEACAQLKIPCVIASSDKAYGEAVTPYTVDSPLNAKYPYDVSKACADKIAQVYMDRGNDVKVVRLCNVFGPGDVHETRLIPHLIKSYLHGERPVLRGDPYMVREWMYIDTAVNTYLMAHASKKRVFVGDGVPAPVYVVVETVRKAFESTITPILEFNANAEIKKQRFYATHINLETLIFREYIERTIDWWRSHERTS